MRNPSCYCYAACLVQSSLPPLDSCFALEQIASGSNAEAAASQYPLQEAAASQLVIVDGLLSLELSSLSSMPDGVYVGGVKDAPSQIVAAQLVSVGRPWLDAHMWTSAHACHPSGT